MDETGDLCVTSSSLTAPECSLKYRGSTVPDAKDNGVSGHPRRCGAITFNITQPTFIPFITQPTIYRVIVYALPCHGLASTTHLTELLTHQQFRLCHACDAIHVHVNLKKNRVVWF